MSRKSALSSEQLQWVIDHGHKNKTVKQLAKKFGLKPCSMTCLLKRHNLTAITHRQIITKKLIKLHNNGELTSINEIAKKINASAPLISEIIDKYGLHITDHRSLMVRLNRFGKTQSEIFKIKSELDYKAEIVRQLLNKKRPSW